jgi:hypothetical protein
MVGAVNRRETVFGVIWRSFSQCIDAKAVRREVGANSADGVCFQALIEWGKLVLKWRSIHLKRRE